ncbi:hemin transporter [Nocardiopsis terrae]|uniref:nitric oxide dioxygenase n=1 Tax=Nocardiopsis terrae TaxID=372655 RepID=A0ABR9HEG7_9ACTN|nr:globin domain-containing protein [Nocardiopsis terrae]MBE1457301.1 nitric oxide dioxygenase [Nocardiopsis terrae]GHC91634.1 hemin transporter [Nocardiopsis terrae]
MLSTESAATIRATIPAVAGALDTITARFYDTMLGEHPELLDGLFNRGNQASGEQRRALAGSIAGFATALLEHPDERPDALLSRIAHKHVSLGITEDQYVIVHKYLFAAIADTLGEAATPDVVAAWDEVYWLMAGSLIAMEARLYQGSGATGRDVWRPWRVADRSAQTPDTVSLTLEPQGDEPAPGFRPGQYVSVRVQLPDGLHQARQYSLSGWDGSRRRITVKRLRAGEHPAGEVSTLLHDSAAPGDTLMVSTPAGDVTLADGDHPLVLASAGIGCTPMVAMLQHLAEQGSTRPVLVLHADRGPEDHAHREEIAALVDRLPGATAHTWYENCQQGCPGDGTGGDHHPGTMDLARVEVPEGAEVYLCGPLPFMRDVRAQFLRAGVPARSVRYEVFGPDLWLGADD